MAGFGCTRRGPQAGAGFFVGGVAIPASGSVPGAAYDLGDYAVLTFAAPWQRFVGTALGAVVGR